MNELMNMIPKLIEKHCNYSIRHIYEWLFLVIYRETCLIKNWAKSKFEKNLETRVSQSVGYCCK